MELYFHSLLALRAIEGRLYCSVNLRLLLDIVYNINFTSKACPNIRKEVDRIMFSDVLEHRFCNICCIQKSRSETVIRNFYVVQAKQFTENKQSNCTRLPSVSFKSIFPSSFHYECGDIHFPFLRGCQISLL